MRVFDTAGNSNDAEVSVTVNNAPGGGSGGSSGESSSKKCGFGAAFASLMMMALAAVGFRRQRR